MSSFNQEISNSDVNNMAKADVESIASVVEIYETIFYTFVNLKNYHETVNR